jgi:hypothetical protein
MATVRPFVVVGSLLLAASALAADGPAGAPSGGPVPPLGGPPAGGPGSGRGTDGFGGGTGGNANKDRARPGMAMLAERRNAEMWKRALEQVLPELPEDVQTKVKAIREDFERQVREFREANGARMREIEQAVRARREAAKEGGADAPGKPDPAMASELQKLKDAMPKPEVAQQKVWELLSPGQQESFKKRYDALQAEARKRAEQRKGGGGEGATDPMEPDPMLPGGERPGKRPAGKPFNFEDAPRDGAGGTPPPADGKPSGR